MLRAIDTRNTVEITTIGVGLQAYYQVRLIANTSGRVSSSFTVKSSEIDVVVTALLMLKEQLASTHDHLTGDSESDTIAAPKGE